MGTVFLWSVGKPEVAPALGQPDPRSALAFSKRDSAPQWVSSTGSGHWLHFNFQRYCRLPELSLEDSVALPGFQAGVCKCQPGSLPLASRPIVPTHRGSLLSMGLLPHALPIPCLADSLHAPLAPDSGLSSASSTNSVLWLDEGTAELSVRSL